MRIGLICLVACAAPAHTTLTPPVPVTAANATVLPPASVRDELVPPPRLTASDGSGLALVRVEARAVVEGPLAFTELHLYFHNDQDRVREGTFQITLPARAAVARFAMAAGDAWLEAEVVPKLVARRAYDDFLHRRQDPALLEKAPGNQFTAKVFPIAPRADKHLVIGYAQELAGERYTLPLRGLPRVAQIDIELAVRGGKTERLAEHDWQPDRDFVATQTGTNAVAAGTLVATTVTLAGTAGPDAPRGITLLVDTSASRALGYAGYLAEIRRLIGALAIDLPLTVVAFDQDSELVFEGRAGDFGDAQLHALGERGAAGASDLGQAVAWIAKHGVQPRVVVVGDGVITAGVDAATAVRPLAGKAERLDVVLAGGLRDDPTARTLARALPHAGAVVELGEAAATALGQAVATNLAIAVPGATWVYPQRIASARAGTSITVLARLAQPATTFEVIAGGEHHTVTALPGSTALIERAAAAGELAALEAQLATAKGDTLALRRTIAAKSVAARVLSTETSLLVLESDADYARYGIARGTDVLVVDANAVTRKRRGAVAVVASKSPIEPPTADDGHGIPLPEPKADYGPDNDHDGIPDAVDRCPDEPETYNGLEDADGCPDRGRLVISSSQIIILQAIHFTANGATLMRESLPILDAVATVLIQNPDIERIEIGGHTDERGDDATNLALSDRRATAVMQYLVGKGVAPARLEAKGYGETRPLDPAHTELAWAKNRRVEFLILRRANTEVAAPATPTAKPQPPPPPPAVTGELAAIEAAIAAHDLDGGLARARTWHDREPGNVLALVGLGEVLEARRATATAARMYGSIIDLYPARADLRRFAGERLARLAPDLAIDTFRRAVADRPDHMTGHRLLAYALERAGRHADAFTAILAGVDQPYRDGSYRGGLRVLGDDAAMLGAVYAAAVPAQRGAIVEALAKRKLALATQPSTRFVLYWETDGNDVDLHVEDARGGHAFYQQPELASGGELYADITTGYGPECFTIPGTPTAGPYRLSVDYYRQGPMGFGMGMVEIQRFDPRRGLSFDDRHYVIMNDHARADVGVVR